MRPTRRRPVDPRTLVIPDERVDSIMTEELAEQFIGSIRDSGIIVPIVCIRLDDRMHVVDGKHRVLAAIDADIPSVEIVYRDGDAVDLDLHNIQTSQLQGKPKPIDVVRALQRVNQVHGLNIEEIVKRTGYSRDYVERYLTLAQAPEWLLDALGDGVIRVGHASELVRLPHELQVSEMFTITVTNKLTVTQLRGQISGVLSAMQVPLAEPEEIGPLPPAMMACAGCGVGYAVGTIRILPICEPDIAALHAAQRLAASQEIATAGP